MTEPTVINGDCREAMQQIPAESVDLIIADPPYNLGKDYGNASDSQQRDDYLRFTTEWLTEAVRILSPTGSLYVFMGFRYISRLFVMLEDDFRLRFNGWISWHYTQGMGRTKGFSPRHDDILYFSKSENYTFNLDDVRVPQKYYRSRNNMRGANPGDVWEFSHVHYCQDSRTGHPTQKPEGLIERIILASSNVNDLVVDPFAGSGTTLRVCQQTERRSLGIEVNIDYCNLIEARLQRPFSGFDGVDPRMLRIPNDLNDPGIRAEYRNNHKKWFLKNHADSHAAFDEAFQKKYGTGNHQLGLFPESRTERAPERGVDTKRVLKS